VLEASGDESKVALDDGVVSRLVSRAARLSNGSVPDREDKGRSSASVFAVGGELLEILGSLPDHRAVVVAVDDAHRMDPSSAGALLFMLWCSYADRVLVLIASRPEGVERLGPSWLRLLSDGQRVQRVRLGGLTTREVRLLSGLLGLESLNLAAAERLRSTPAGTLCTSRPPRRAAGGRVGG